MKRALIFVVAAACGAPGAATPIEPVDPIEPVADRSTPAVAPAPERAPAAIGEPRTPCFDGPPLVASTVYRDLERFSASMHIYDGTSPLPAGEYGTCAVRDAELYDSAGASVATLGCGILVKRPGLVDHVGLQVGSPGQLAVERHPNAADRIACVAAGEQTNCWFRDIRDYVEPVATYTVDAPLGADSATGDDAIAILAAHDIAKFHMTIYCH